MVKAEKLELFFKLEVNSRDFLCLAGTAATGMHRAAHAQRHFHPIGEVVYGKPGLQDCHQPDTTNTHVLAHLWRCV